MAGTLAEIKETTTTINIEPGKFRVVLLDDDVTPMAFVVALLMKVFKHSEEVATELTNQIHNEGRAIAGIFSFEIAEQKGMEATNLARHHGFPLIVKVEAV